MNKLKQSFSRALRKQRIRTRVAGTAERPRLNVFISNQHISAQIIDDSAQSTLASASTLSKSPMTGSMTEKAAEIGSRIAKSAKKAGVSKVVFDRNGRQYAQRLKSLADAARKEGLEF